MLVTAQNSAPCRVFDANGLEWKHMRWVNTETGEGEQCVLDANGQKRLNATRKAVLTQAVKLAAPVLIMPINKAAEIKLQWSETPIPLESLGPGVELIELRKGGA